MGLLNINEKPKLPVSSGLVLDMNADRGLSIEDDSMITTWTNQAPKALAVDFNTTEEGRKKTIISQDEPGTGRPSILDNNSEINGHNSLVFREDELINDNDEAFRGMLTGQYAGFWGSFYPDGRVYMGSRNGLNEKVRDSVNTPEVEGPPPAVNSSDFPVGDVEPSRMAIGTERNAINHQGKESFDGELARLLMYETALDQPEMKAVFDYLRTVFGRS